jgi:hypothetical protein
MNSKPYNRDGFVRLEVLLVLAFLALFFQVFPSLWSGVLWALDMRNWSRGTWMVLNVVVVVFLFALRFGPELYQEWRKTPRHRSVKLECDEKRLSREEELALYQRMQEARKRQVV